MKIELSDFVLEDLKQFISADVAYLAIQDEVINSNPTSLAEMDAFMEKLDSARSKQESCARVLCRSLRDLVAKADPDILADVLVDVPETAPEDAPADSPADAPETAPADSPADAPADSPADAPADSPADAPADSPADAPADVPVDVPEVDPEHPADVNTVHPVTFTRDQLSEKAYKAYSVFSSYAYFLGDDGSYYLDDGIGLNAYSPIASSLSEMIEFLESLVDFCHAGSVPKDASVDSPETVPVQSAKCKLCPSCVDGRCFFVPDAYDSDFPCLSPAWDNFFRGGSHSPAPCRYSAGDMVPQQWGKDPERS